MPILRFQGAPAAIAIAGLVALGVTFAPAIAAQADSARHGAAFTIRDAEWLSAATAGSLLLINADARLTRDALNSSINHGGFVRSSFDVGRQFGEPSALVLGAGLFGVGVLTHDRTPERVGLRAMEGIAASSALTAVVKGLTGRARPNQSPGNPRDFVFGRGIRDGGEFESYPSGHATAAFAFASAVDAEWARLSPHRPRWVGPALYALAGLTAASRVFDDRHWTSDVVLGSAIGFVVGRAVVRWHADQP